MSRSKERLSDYLDHILQAIERIGRYTKDLDETAFLQNELVQDAVIRNIEIVGEASNNVLKHYPDFIATHQHLPFAFAYQMRNAVTHGYAKVDFEIVWRTIQNDLVSFYNEVKQAAQTLPSVERP